MSWFVGFAPAKTSVTLHPAWGAKKVGEKLSFSPRASGGVT